MAFYNPGTIKINTVNKKNAATNQMISYSLLVKLQASHPDKFHSFFAYPFYLYAEIGSYSSCLYPNTRRTDTLHTKLAEGTQCTGIGTEVNFLHSSCNGAVF